MGIQVNITAGKDEKSSSVSATGSVQHIITDDERTTFKLNDSQLKSAINKYFGKAPNDAYLHSPTPWNDLYKTYHWEQVQTFLQVHSATIVGIFSTPIIIAEKELINNSSKKATFNAGITGEVNDTTTNTWSQTNSIQVGQTFSYNVSFLGSGGGGETSLSYTGTWGQEESKSKSVTVGSEQGVSVELDPGQAVKVELTASRGVLKVRIVYKAYLAGDSAINYNPTYRDHHFWGLEIGSIMEASNLQNSLEFTEDIEVGYYTNSKIILKDMDGAVLDSFVTSAQPGVIEPSEYEQLVKKQTA